jgi:hypothetical protein
MNLWTLSSLNRVPRYKREDLSSSVVFSVLNLVDEGKRECGGKRSGCIDNVRTFISVFPFFLCEGVRVFLFFVCEAV